MRITEILSINFKKLKTKSKRAMFLIVPVFLLVAISVVLSSQISNIQYSIKNSVFSSISNKYNLIKLQIERKAFDPSSVFQDRTSVEQNRYSKSDVQAIETIQGVKNASLEAEVPIRNISTTNLYEGKTISLSGSTYFLDSNTAKLYTTEDFTYTEGQPIPIVINTSSLVTTYEDWSDGKTITMDLSSFKPGQGQLQRESFMKTEAIEYNKEELLGKEFNISFGGLDAIQDYTITRDGSKTTIRKMTTAAYKEAIAERKDNISTYWNYTKISTPLTYKFKIVGIIDDKSTTNNYIPESFSSSLMYSYIAKEINARVATVPTTSLNSDYMGMTYNQDEISTQTGGVFGQIGRRFEGMQGLHGGDSSNVSFSNINIPGLVVETDESNKVVGVMTNSKIYTKANKYGDTINIVLDDLSNRSTVISAINKAGYAYQDNSELEALNNLEKTLDYVSKGLLISFIVLVGGVVVLTASKFLSESIKEIGIFRAIGMKQSEVLILFISQTMLYVSLGFVIGTGIGYGLNMLASKFVAVWFSTFVSSTISKTVSVVTTVDSSVFSLISWDSIVLYAIVLFALSLILSILPSISASHVSPVEAIKNE